MAVDVSKLELVGEGHHGTVYKLDESTCIKIYRKNSVCQMEYEVLKHSESYSFFPRVLECKDNYIIREFFQGPNLWEYLQTHALRADIVTQLLAMIDAFISLGYSKIDCHLHHIIITEGQCLKFIDPTTNMSRKAAYPRVLLKQLEQLGHKDDFLSYTKVFRPEYYAKWHNV